MTNSPDFTIFPAIDLRAGQVVRLQKGDPNRQTSYGNDPALVARRWLSHGARWLHVVNLDGAFGEGDQVNQSAIRAILDAMSGSGVKVQMGGGLRSLKAIEIALGLGVERAILGTRAVEEPALLAKAIKRWGAERIAVSLDALDGKVRVAGWVEATDLDVEETALAFKSLGLRWLVFTDIARDGIGQGLNLDKTVDLAQKTGLAVVASGGVGSIEDVAAVKAAGLPGVIVGRALYEGQIEPGLLFQLEEASHLEGESGD